MKKHELYISILKQLDKYVTVREWATEIEKQYPSHETNDDNNKKLFTKITNYLHTQLSTGKWSNMISVNKDIRPQKVKYTSDIHLKIENTGSLPTSVKAVKSVKFELLMEEIKYSLDVEELPKRKDYVIFETFNNAIGYKEFVAFEMAKRNKNVLEICNKLDYIEKIIKTLQKLDNQYKDWLLGIKYWESMFESDPPEFDVDCEIKEHYIFIANLPVPEFKEEINSLNKKQGDIITKPENLIYLKIIADFLQEKLVDKYYIFKEGYFWIKNSEYFDPNEVIDSDHFTKNNYNTYRLNDELKLSFDKFMSLKADNMERTADLFFMYDYYKVRKDSGYENLTNLDLKLELTKYHGIKIKSGDKTLTLSYDECLQRYKEFIDSEAIFYDVEKTIAKKIKLMEEFINKDLYRYIIFY